MNKVLPGDEVIGIPTALTILQRVRGTIQGFQLGRRQLTWILPTIRRTLFLILVVHDQFGSRKTIRRFQKYALYCGVTTRICPCSNSFVFANSEGETCRENCFLFMFPTTPPCFATVDALETGDVPILFSLLHLQNLGIAFELDHRVRDRFA